MTSLQPIDFKLKSHHKSPDFTLHVNDSRTTASILDEITLQVTTNTGEILGEGRKISYNH